ncbi:MAG: glutaredoxin family protein [Actinomycetota bacterium]
MTPRIVLLSRPGCGLCRTAREVLERERARTDFELEEVDISTDLELERTYGIRIPVVLLDGEEFAEIEVDPKALRRAVRARARAG